MFFIIANARLHMQGSNFFGVIAMSPIVPIIDNKIVSLEINERLFLKKYFLLTKLLLDISRKLFLISLACK